MTGSGRVSQAFQAEKICAVICLVDISGFTKMSDSFHAHGQRGLDSFTSIINEIFSTIVDHVQRWGGDIVKFAG